MAPRLSASATLKLVFSARERHLAPDRHDLSESTCREAIIRIVIVSRCVSRQSQRP